MAHLRARKISDNLKKNIKLWPVINVFGPRQCGKSTLLKELIWKEREFTYVSLDRIRNREEAQSNPELFLSRFDLEPIVIDEAHKAPHLFDEVKASVDEGRRPGRFVLTGSVAFSKKLGIRESLTGRSSIIRMDSMTLKETLGQKNVTIKDVLRYFKQGGMPAVCFLRDPEMLRRYWDEWLDTICHRDFVDGSGSRLIPDLAYRILEASAQSEVPTLINIANKLKVDARRIKSHVEVLMSLFLLRKIAPISGKKEIYIPFDCGLASFFKASDQRLFQIFIAHQFTNQERFQGRKDPALFFDLTRNGSYVDLVVGGQAFLFCERAYPSAHMQKTIHAIEKRLPKLDLNVCCATDEGVTKLSKKTRIVGWRDLVS